MIKALSKSVFISTYHADYLKPDSKKITKSEAIDYLEELNAKYRNPLFLSL